MSLDVYLIQRGVQNIGGERIFIRDEGQTREITREDWDSRFPDREPVVTNCVSDDEYVYNANYTHNCGRMADQAGIYKQLWRPDEIGITKAEQLIEPLTNGLELMRAEPERFKRFNPDNGWGSYDTFVPWIQAYLDACKTYPDAEVRVSR